MENYEQKYKECVEKARKIKEENPELWNSPHCIIRNFFPELAENNDERIRKELLNYCKVAADGEVEVLPNIDFNKSIAWLEKQGEKKPAWSEEDEEMFKCVKSHIEYAVGVAWPGYKQIFRQRMIDWLKSLKERMKGENK